MTPHAHGGNLPTSLKHYLQVGAKVLLLKNLDSSSQLVNGATGVVTEFVEASGRKLPKVAKNNDVYYRCARYSSILLRRDFKRIQKEFWYTSYGSVPTTSQ